jgi:DNA invertase Pin-like site-specific DNA recombinase
MTNYNSQARKPFIPVITPERIQLLVKEYGSPAKVAKAIGVHRMTIVRWAKFGIPEGSPYLGKF